MSDCGGCEGTGSHRRHCHANPDYTREREWADRAEDLGDTIGPNNMAAANACYRAAGLLRAGIDGSVQLRTLMADAKTAQQHSPDRRLS